MNKNNKGSTVPLGFHFAAHWKTINRYNPKDAHTFAGHAVAYALTGEPPPAGSVPEDAWEETKRETDGLNAERAARKYAADCRWAKEHGLPLPPPPDKMQTPMQTPMQSECKTDAYEDENENKEKRKIQPVSEDGTKNPEDETEREARDGRLSVGGAVGALLSGSALRGCPEDEERARLNASDAAAVEGALAFNGETASDKSRNALRKILRRIGRSAFVEELLAFKAEVRAGEEPRNRGAAFYSRLKRVAGETPATVAPTPTANPEPPTPASPSPPTIETPPPGGGEWVEPQTIVSTAQRNGAATADDVRRAAAGLNACTAAADAAVAEWMRTA